MDMDINTPATIIINYPIALSLDEEEVLPDEPN
jgi:hypothetical protein